MKRGIFFTIISVVIMLNVQSIDAGTIPLSGSVSSSDGSLMATPSWSSGEGTTLTWDIEDKGSYYTYSYKFIVPVLDRDKVKDLSHIIFEVSDTFTGDNFLGSSDDKYEEIGAFSSKNGNPQMPGSFEVGIKFDEGDLESSLDGAIKTFFITFDSDRVPTWGDFYAKGGEEEDINPALASILSLESDEKIYVTAWNSGFMYPENGAKIVVPDTLPKVPVPGAILLSVLGIMVSGIKLRKFT